LAVLADKGFEDGGDHLLLRAREIVGLLEKLFHSSGRSGASFLFLFFFLADQIRDRDIQSEGKLLKLVGTVTTVEGERVPIPGTENFARRKQKVYQDILGRTWKTEAYEWDGTTVYATAVNTFNGRDQVTRTREFAGSATNRQGNSKHGRYPFDLIE